MIETSSPPVESARRSRSLSRRIFFRLVYVTYLIGLVWGGCRLVWWAKFGVPITKRLDRETIMTINYPVLKTAGLMAAETQPRANDFNVLLLGASVLEQCAPVFAERSQREFARAWKTFNLCFAAHTTRDSWLKYDFVKDQPFRLIIIHHAINDARMNCCLPGTFKADYTHCCWYEAMKYELESGSFLLPEALRLSMKNHIELGEPKGERVAEGGDLKTPPAFRANIEAIIQAAAVRGSRVVLITFALHLPENYLRDAFMKGELDYGSGPHRLPAELWGRPEHVRAAVAAHNDVMRKLGQDYPQEVVLIDLAAEFPEDGAYFCDPCHLTALGVERWNEIVFRELHRQGVAAQ